MSRTSTGAVHGSVILTIILVSYFMILLDNSIIFTGLPGIQADMGYSTTALAWVQDAYTLVFGGLLLLGARAGDLLGRRRVFVFGLAVFATASLLIGLAPAGWWLIGARALQGIGAAIVAPSSLSLLTASFPPGRDRTRAVAWYGATAGIGASLGLVIGGALAHWISWRAGFFINVPIGLAMIILAPRYLAESQRTSGRFDVVGAITATLGMGGLVFGIISSADAGWGAPATIAAFGAGIVLLALFVANEWRADQPIMPLRLLASRERSGAYAARLLYMGAMIGFFYFTTQFLQEVLRFNPLQAGFAFFLMTVVNFAVAMAILKLTARFGNAALLAAGVAVTLAGMVWLGRLDVNSPYLTGVALPMVLLGIGQGLAFAPLTSAGIARVTAKDAGAASGLVNTAHQLGSSLGLGILVTAAAGTGDGPARAALAGHVSAALTAGSILLALCLGVALALIVPAAITARRAASRTPNPTPTPLIHAAKEPA
ncbi:MFS transporter [Specibacter cremeus]|uniref:MFS transporter n=1 Tax=Specibacter cremeus TaxID=1629051 RepID=UPI000F78A90D|nr:MFS transporter [Specibacter cremeus]